MPVLLRSRVERGNKAVKSSFADRLLRVLDAERVAIVFVLFNFIMWTRAWAATAVSNTTLDLESLPHGGYCRGHARKSVPTVPDR